MTQRNKTIDTQLKLGFVFCVWSLTICYVKRFRWITNYLVGDWKSKLFAKYDAYSETGLKSLYLQPNCKTIELHTNFQLQQKRFSCWVFIFVVYSSDSDVCLFLLKLCVEKFIFSNLRFTFLTLTIEIWNEI